MFQDLANQAYEAHLIKQPKLISLVKFSLSFFAEMRILQKADQARASKVHIDDIIEESSIITLQSVRLC
jgi:hypothetical protein